MAWADCAISERCGEGFEGIGDDGGAVEGAEFFGIGDGVEGIAEAVGDGAEAEIEGFEDGLAAGIGTLFHAAFLFAGVEAFLNSFLAELLGEGHGAGAEGWVANGLNFADESGPVNWVGAGEEEANEAVEEAAGDMGEEVAGDNVEAGGHGWGMRCVLMVFVVLAVVMGGEVWERRAGAAGSLDGQSVDGIVGALAERGGWSYELP